MNQCCDQDQRRAAMHAADGWNGLDYVEVSEDQLTLSAYFFGKLPPELAKPAPDLARFLRIAGGRRIRDIQITSVQPLPSDHPDKDDVLQVQLSKWGDFSVYALELVNLKNIDQRYARAEFSFKTACAADLDCAQCPPPDEPPLPQPLLNYMAKDYASFRQLMLDRLALLIPDWQERHIPDIGVTLVELLAYCADQLSYYQDAVATEAYLDTARQRISVRRHARLVDYRMHEGCNARAWLCLQSDQDIVLPLEGAAFLTGMNEALAGKAAMLQWDDLRDVTRADYEVFEPLWPRGSMALRSAHNAIEFYTWGGEFCALDVGSTGATLLDAWRGPDSAERALQLQVGDILILEEVRNAQTGLTQDADRRRRHAVRLTQVTPNTDQLLSLPDGRDIPLLDICWAQADALPFALRLSSLAADCRLLGTDEAPLALARGNVLLIDAGQTLPTQELGVVPAADSELACLCVGQPGDIIRQAGTFQPKLGNAPLAWAEPVDAASLPAACDFFRRDPRMALPQLQVSDDSGEHWLPRYDLIASASHETHLVVECDNSGRAQLRFGDGELGAQPTAGRRFQAQYRVLSASGAPAANVGADAITHIVLPQLLSGVELSARNPLPACGGALPEPLAEVKMYAPQAIRQQIERAVIAQDYQTLAGRNPALQRASAQLVWTGSWNEAEVTLDPLGSEQVGADLLAQVDDFLQDYRRMGHDVRVKAAVYVPLDIGLEVCVKPDYQRAHVLAALRAAFSNRRLPGGKLGFFHPDQLSFGGHIYLSRIVALGQAQEGVECVTVTRLQRLFSSANQELEQGVLPLRSWEIAQLDNDPNFPEQGKLAITLHGGR